MGRWRVRKTRTASGAVAVQLVREVRRVVVDVEHVGSAHDDAELGLLLEAANDRLGAGQGVLDLGPLERVVPSVGDIADWSGRAGGSALLGGLGGGPGRREAVAGGARVVSTSADALWGVLEGAWERLGFAAAVPDGVFAKVALARVVEATSKAGALRVMAEVGVPAPSERTVFRMLRRCVDRDYRGKLAAACDRWASRGGRPAMVLYDATSLWYTSDAEDKVRKPGRGKEHRPGPQVQVGLLVDPGGFPLEAHLFPGNKAEVKTILPVLEGYRARTGVEGMVVVADAAMLSAKNLSALEKAGFGFIVGSKQTKGADDLAGHFARCGDYFPDGATVEASRVMGRGADAKTRRVVWHYSFKRHKRDDRAINKQIERAEKTASGELELRKARFLKMDGASMGLNQALIDRARRLAGLKGYVTSLTAEQMPAGEVVAAYHQLYEVERSFRMAKSDLRARPIFHHLEDSIEAHLTIVFAALAVSRHLQDATGVSIKRLVTTLRQVRSAVIEVAGRRLTLPPAVPQRAQEIIDAANAGTY